MSRMRQSVALLFALAVGSVVVTATLGAGAVRQTASAADRRVLTAAEAFLATLDARQRAKANIELSAKARTVWSNLPTGIAHGNRHRAGRTNEKPDQELVVRIARALQRAEPRLPGHVGRGHHRESRRRATRGRDAGGVSIDDAEYLRVRQCRSGSQCAIARRSASATSSDRTLRSGCRRYDFRNSTRYSEAGWLFGAQSGMVCTWVSTMPTSLATTWGGTPCPPRLASTPDGT